MASKRHNVPPPPARRKRPPGRLPTEPLSRLKKPPLRIYSILAWADEHHARTGRWPTSYSGRLRVAPWETWRGIDGALRRGYRGRRGGDSLPLLLHRHRGRPLPRSQPRPRLTVRQILRWADAYHRRTGQWPSRNTPGPVAEGLEDDWRAIETALRSGWRGLPGGDSLAQTLLRHRGFRRARNRPRLTIKQILAYADRYHARYGRWPTATSGSVDGAPGDTWLAMDMALRHQCRGLPPGYSLATLLEKHRGARHRLHLPRLTAVEILAWADAYHRRHGSWPSRRSGPIPEAPGETWMVIARALHLGRRGLPGGDSLFRLLRRAGRTQKRGDRASASPRRRPPSAQ